MILAGKFKMYTMVFHSGNTKPHLVLPQETFMAAGLYYKEHQRFVVMDNTLKTKKLTL